MREHAGAMAGRLALMIALVLVFALALSVSAYAATPTTPVFEDIFPSGSNQVTLKWLESTDADGHGITYEIYRSKAPITQSMITPKSTLVTGPLNATDHGLSLSSVGAAWTAVVNADVAGGEVLDSYVWFYVIRATETATPANSPISSAMAPNMHGWQTAENVESCQRCHNVHGAPTPPGIVDRSSWICYYCHGTSTTTTSGNDGSAAGDLGDKSTLHTQKDFYDYTPDPPTGGSRHRSTWMTDNNQQCRACHSPHRTPVYYGTDGVAVPGSSFRDMLRVRTGGTDAKPTYAQPYYSPNTLLSESTAFCFSCHGSTTTDAARTDELGTDGSAATNMGYVSTNGFGATAGDHNESGYASAAHGPSIIYSNDYVPSTPTADDTYPQVQCLACHDNHASAADKLIAYRGNDYKDEPTLDTYAQADLCYACHSGGSTESRVDATTYSAPFSWNDRDVRDQFTNVARRSAHPTTPAETGRSLACASCHNVHYVGTGGATAWDTSRVSTPSGTKTTPADMTGFCLDCHDGAPAAVTTDANTLVPYRIGFSDQSAAPYFTGWDKSGFTGSGHYAAAAADGKALCQNCHDPHASDFARLTAWTTPGGVTGLNDGTRVNTSIGMSREQNLCYQCHGNGTTTVDSVTTRRAPGAKDVVTKATATYAHDPGDTTGAHSDTESAADLATRHAECEDCHNPHYTRKVGGVATQDTANTSIAGGAVYGVYGVKPTYTVANWGAASAHTPELLTGTTTSGSEDHEAYLCFKCHSTNTTQPTSVTRDTKTYTPTDVAREFNPSNFSYHNVLGQTVGMQSSFSVIPDNGTTPITVAWPIPTVNVFLAGYGPNAMLTCTSCHTNESNAGTQAKGPHGSTAQWTIDPLYGTDWKTAGLSSGSSNGMEFAGGADATTIICAKCHDLYNAGTGDGGWSNTGHSRMGHWVTHTQPKYCTNCHIGVPHGWKRPRLIGYYDDDSPYSTRINNTGGQISYPLIEVEASSRSLSSGAVSWSCSHCKTTSDGRHPTDIAASWP